MTSCAIREQILAQPDAPVGERAVDQPPSEKLWSFVVRWHREITRMVGPVVKVAEQQAGMAFELLILGAEAAVFDPACEEGVRRRYLRAVGMPSWVEDFEGQPAP